jgi:Tfp pilus assembly protein PilO
MANHKESPKSGIIFGIIIAIIVIWGSYEISNRSYFDPLEMEMLGQQQKLDELKKSNDENEKIKANAVQLESSLTDVENRYASLKPLVPPEAELPKILDWIASKAYERGLKLEHFSQGTQVKQIGSMSEIPIQVEVLGNYDGVSRFVGDFSRFERVLRVRGLHMLQEQQQESEFATMRANISFSAYVSKEKAAAAASSGKAQ